MAGRKKSTVKLEKIKHLLPRAFTTELYSVRTPQNESEKKLADLMAYQSGDITLDEYEALHGKLSK